ncbi:unnamed protein product [Echinostoma caproni]|uniref:Tho1_MOS11_C domain-containing protein n=1 Tax=Echinostoma caproni TaxID=27848 RepID=A0A183AX85_9TREM|nr:unnamed protein product [Echinostoma caproni]
MKDSFSILQPGEEAQLLGDDDAGDDSTVFRVTDSSLDSLATPVGKASSEIVDNNSSSTITQIHKSTPQVAGVKRSSDALQTTSNENSEASADSKEITSVSNEIQLNENSTCSELQVLAKRANRFGLLRPAGGLSLTDDKLVARAKRFGLPVAEGLTGVDGLRPITTGSPVISTDEADKLRRRAERFGEVTSKPVQKVNQLYKMLFGC